MKGVKEMLEREARDEMLGWLATMSKRQELREDADALSLELEMIEEALHNNRARIAANVRAIFHYLKAKEGLIYWPTPPQIAAAAKHLARSANVNQQTGKGDRAALSFDEAETLETRILPKAREFLSIPGLRQHGVQTLEYWGERYQ